MHSAEGNKSVVAFWLFLALQIIFVIIFGAIGQYDKGLLPPNEGDEAEVHQSKYPRKDRRRVLKVSLS